MGDSRSPSLSKHCDVIKTLCVCFFIIELYFLIWFAHLVFLSGDSFRPTMVTSDAAPFS